MTGGLVINRVKYQFSGIWILRKHCKVRFHCNCNIKYCNFVTPDNLRLSFVPVYSNPFSAIFLYNFWTPKWLQLFVDFKYDRHIRKKLLKGRNGTERKISPLLAHNTTSSKPGKFHDRGQGVSTSATSLLTLHQNAKAPNNFPHCLGRQLLSYVFFHLLSCRKCPVCVPPRLSRKSRSHHHLLHDSSWCYTSCHGWFGRYDWSTNSVFVNYGGLLHSECRIGLAK